MEIDNSAANDMRECPWLYYEKYVKGIEKKPAGDETYGPMELGARVHELLEMHYCPDGKRYEPSTNVALEDEAQWILECYRARYPVEDFEVVDVERSFKVALPDYCPQCYQQDFYPSETHENFIYCNYCDGPPFSIGRHIYTGKIDLLYKQDGKLYIMDHKTQKRGAKSNTPSKWAAKDQGTLYLWAAEKIYGQEIDRFVVNILTRPSPKGREGPSFPDRMPIERTDIQVETALRDLVLVADTIEHYKKVFGDKPWPAHRENCEAWGQCEFYVPHLYGWSDAIRQAKFREKKPYLELAGVPIIQ